MALSLDRIGLLGLTLVAAAACGGNVTRANSSGTGTGGGGGGGDTGSTASSSTGGGAASSSSASSASSSSSSGKSSSSSSSSSSSTTTGGPFKEGPFPTPPQVQSYGGPVLANPNIYGIFFAGDDPTLTSSLADFTTKIGTTPYWQATTSEYGIGPATAQIITLTETAATNLQDSQIQTWLAGKFGTDPKFPAAPGPNDVYILYYPAGVSIQLQGTTSCQYFGGYHNSTTFNGQDVAYAVLPRCQEQGMSLLDVATSSASHELIEAATDPYPMHNPAYAYPDFLPLIEALGGGEIGDMCAQQPQNFTKFPGFAYMVQRTWSNVAAFNGHDPCQPEPAGEIYYAAAPVFTQMVNYDIQGQMVPVPGVKIPVGQSATIPVEFFSDAATTAWPAQAFDYNSQFNQGSALLNLTLTPPSGQNGTKGTLQITVNKAGQNNEELFFIVSSRDNGATVNWWFGLVTN